MECLVDAIEDIDNYELPIVVFGVKLEPLGVVPDVGGGPKLFDSLDKNWMCISVEKTRIKDVHILIHHCLDSQLITSNVMRVDDL